MDANKASFTNTVDMQRNITMNRAKMNVGLLFCCHVLHNVTQLQWIVFEMWT